MKYQLILKVLLKQVLLAFLGTVLFLTSGCDDSRGFRGHLDGRDSNRVSVGTPRGPSDRRSTPFRLRSPEAIREQLKKIRAERASMKAAWDPNKLPRTYFDKVIVETHADFARAEKTVDVGGTTVPTLELCLHAKVESRKRTVPVTNLKFDLRRSKNCHAKSSDLPLMSDITLKSMPNTSEISVSNPKRMFEIKDDMDNQIGRVEVQWALMSIEHPKTKQLVVTTGWQFKIVELSP